MVNPRLPILFLGLALPALLFLAGCEEEQFRPGTPAAVTRPTDEDEHAPQGANEDRKVMLLRSVIQLIEDAATTPGGKNLVTASDYLNEYFEGTKPEEYALAPETRAFLTERKFSQGAMTDRERPRFDAQADPLHVQDCLLYQAVATHAAGRGDDLTRVRRVFDWVSRNVLLVPPEFLSTPGVVYQAQARPYDVLVRGMATEGDGAWTDKKEKGYWSERGWVFMVLCRQLGVDVGLVAITPQGAEKRQYWVCAALVDGKVYLFDHRLGVEVPAPDGRSVATLDQVLEQPALLDRLNHTGDEKWKYDISPSDLSGAKVEIALDASPGYYTPRMRLLQRELAARNRMVLFREPAAQAQAFQKALGDRLAGVDLWLLPLEVEFRLFRDPQFVQSTLGPLRLYHPGLPLLGARLLQLRGETATAIQTYVSFRMNPNVVFEENKKKFPVPPEQLDALNTTATYFLALCQMENGAMGQAENLFEQTLKRTPEPKPGPPYVSLFHFGAVSNLGRLHEDKGELEKAVAFYKRELPTPQMIGNLYRAGLLAPKVAPEAPDEAKSSRPEIKPESKVP